MARKIVSKSNEELLFAILDYSWLHGNSAHLKRQIFYKI